MILRLFLSWMNATMFKYWKSNLWFLEMLWIFNALENLPDLKSLLCSLILFDGFFACLSNIWVRAVLTVNSIYTCVAEWISNYYLVREFGTTIKDMLRDI